MTDLDATQLDAEDAKLVTLARAARARVAAVEGVAVRDLDGRTYTAVSVGLPSLALTALQGAVAAAVSSGARGLEAAAVVTDGPADDVEVAVVADLGGPGTPVVVARPDGGVVAVRSA